jgi:hypothetical protein
MSIIKLNCLKFMILLLVVCGLLATGCKQKPPPSASTAAEFVAVSFATDWKAQAEHG